MGVQILELTIIILGSLNDGYFDYDTVDGFKFFRYCYLIGEQVAFLVLCSATLIEPVFVLWARQQIKRVKKLVRGSTYNPNNNSIVGQDFPDDD